MAGALVRTKSKENAIAINARRFSLGWEISMGLTFTNGPVKSVTSGVMHSHIDLWRELMIFATEAETE